MNACDPLLTLSYLVIPCNKIPRFLPSLKRILTSPDSDQIPHAVIFDLEDSIPPDRKTDARLALADAISQGLLELCNSVHVLVKVNGPGTNELDADLECLKTYWQERLGLAIPKVEECDTVKELLGRIGAKPARCLPTIETVRGFTNRDAILFSWAGLGVRQFAFGAGDMSLSLGVQRDYALPILNYVLTALLVSARVAGLRLIDSPSRDIPKDGNSEARSHVENECHLSARNGASGRIAIHPTQVPIINSIFRADHQLAEAEALLALFADNPDTRALVDPRSGRYVGTPSYRYALEKKRLESKTAPNADAPKKNVP